MGEFILQQAIFALRIVLACVCGGVIGYERKNRGKGAGIRTHIIVALASALMMIVSKYGFSDIVNYPGTRGADSARIAAQVVSGVGFLGAGMIYFNKNTVKGLTTAAGIWATAGVGLALGAGLYVIGILTTVFIVFVQVVLHKNLKIMNMPSEESVRVIIDDNKESMEFLNNLFLQYSINVLNMQCTRHDNGTVEFDLDINAPSDFDTNEFMAAFQESKYIKLISI